MPSNKISDYKKRSIISMVSEGISYKEIARELEISPRTVVRVVIADDKEQE